MFQVKKIDNICNIMQILSITMKKCMKYVNLPISPLLFYQNVTYEKSISSQSFYPIGLKFLHNVHKT